MCYKLQFHSPKSYTHFQYVLHIAEPGGRVILLRLYGALETVPLVVRIVHRVVPLPTFGGPNIKKLFAIQ
jgi:hypothetical protein